MALPFSLDDQFAVLREIKAGGFGIVYAGWDENLHLPVALKEIHPELLRQESALAAFQAEAQLIARLDHPGICRLYTLKRSRGRVFMIMEFIDGGDLRNLQLWLKERGRKLTPRTLIYITRQVGKALHYAHLRADPTTGAPLHLVHRDVAPSNFMISRQGAVKLIDFGIARVAGLVRPETMGGVIKGRPQYMSPEQIHSPEQLDARSDIYSLAVVFLDLLTGESVYGKTTNEYELMDRVRARRFELPEYFVAHDIPRELHAPIESALKLAPLERTETARAFIDQLDPYARSVGYDERRAHEELKQLAGEAFPSANLQQEFERFQQSRDGASTVTVQLPREHTSPPGLESATKPTRRPEPAPIAAPHERRKAGITPWLLAVVVTAAIAAGVWVLFLRPQAVELASFPITTLPGDSAAAGKPGDSVTTPAVDPAGATGGVDSTPLMRGTPDDSVETEEGSVRNEVRTAKREPVNAKPRELPVLLKPGAAANPAPAPSGHPGNAGNLGIQADRNATLFVDDRQVGYLLAGDPLWTAVSPGRRTIRIEAEGNPGCPLSKEIVVNAPLDDVKIVNLASGTLQVNGRIPAGTKVKISPVTPDIRIGAGCEVLTAPFTYRLLAGTYVVETTVNGQPYERKNLTINSGATVTLTFQ
ncbi:serine/threonine protein kinase [candidate division KSB1 bacterium]|nr:serine/threonine protein kinase [candidate division KSB1 bacterium]